MGTSSSSQSSLRSMREVLRPKMGGEGEGDRVRGLMSVGDGESVAGAMG